MSALTDREREALQAAMVRLAEGERAAFRPLFDGLWPLLAQFARHTLNDAPDAEDAAQRAMMTLLREAPRFDPERSVVGWAITLCAWECRTARRKTGRRRETSDTPLTYLAAQDTDPENRALRARMVEAATAVMGQLSTDDQETLLRTFDDRGAPTGTTAATFRKRRQRALSRLRTAWRSRHG